ncbi:sensor histidine kinase [Streptomyces sp. NPDC059063]|uniref:sensor histidine kinase n=1 Tax=unclassified Streptomyces TaxID=2593676 RepID=UPI0036B3E1D2
MRDAMRLPAHPPAPFAGITRLLAVAAGRLTGRRVRVRLTLLYGVLFVVSGAVLLAITYLLVTHASENLTLVGSHNGKPTLVTGGEALSRVDSLPGGGAPKSLDAFTQTLRDQAYSQHQEELRHLLVQSGIALGIMAVLSIALGWLVAGRVLRPLRTMTGTIRSISARNLHERLAVAGPADELKDLADTVDGLLGRLESALDSHKRFVANAAHELRTPLTLEHALVEESLMDREATVESYRSNLERLLAISEQQARLLESLLTLSSSERGLDRHEPVDLAALAEQVVRMPRPDVGRRGLRVEASTAPAATTGDSALVQRLVANLVDNAVGYNVPGGHVEITTGTRDGHAVVTVTNTGPEVPPEQVERLFEPFQRLGRTADEGHHGLGLSIVRTIATAHDARLTAHARPGGGLAVEVAFPPTGRGLARATPEHAPAAAP